MVDSLLKVKEAAARLGVSRSLVYLLISSGRLRSVKLGRSRRIPVSCLDEFIAHLMADEQPDDRPTMGAP